MGAKLVKAADVAKHAAAVDTWWSDVRIERALLESERLRVDVIDALTTRPEIMRTIKGAPTVTLEVFDPKLTIVNELLPEASEVALDLDGYRFLLAQASKRGDVVSLVFEDEPVALMRRYRKFRKARRGKTTRAEFLYGLAREVREATIPFYCPELHERQPVGKATKPSRTAKQAIPKRNSLRVKSTEMDDAQRRVANAILDACAKYRAPRRAMVAAIACAIQEKFLRNSAGGDRDSTGTFQQRASTGWKGNLLDIDNQVRNFLKRAPTTPFLTVLKEHPGKSLGWQISQTQRDYTFGTANQGKDFNQWKGQAEKIVKAYLGGSSVTTVKPYEFTRGKPGEREDTWVAGQRLAEEVRWRFYSDLGLVTYIDDEDLRNAEAVTKIRHGEDGIYFPDFDMDFGKKAATLEVKAIAAAIAAAPGTVFDVDGAGPANGLWLIESMTRKMGDPEESWTLARPAPPRAEPAAEQTTKSGSGGSKSSGWVSPLKTMRPITGRFGEQRPGHKHAGVDIAVPSGTSVRAAADGRVTHAGAEGGYGNSVVVKHADGYSTRYAHLSTIGVRVGKQVHAGDVIAKSGNTGNSSGPHLHFELLKNGAATCPASKVPGIPKSACV